jgi:hypothetical protein
MSLRDKTTPGDRRYLFELFAINSADPFCFSAQAFLVERLETALDVRDGSETSLVRKERLRKLLTKAANRWRMKLRSYPVANSDSDASRDATPGLPLWRVHAGPAKGNVAPGE